MASEAAYWMGRYDDLLGHIDHLRAVIEVSGLAECDVWCDLEGCASQHLPRGHADAVAAMRMTARVAALTAPSEVRDA